MKGVRSKSTSAMALDGGSSGEDVATKQRNNKGKTPIMEAPLIGNTYYKDTAGDSTYGDRGTNYRVEKSGMKRGFGIIDFVVRIAAIVAVLAATVAMGTTEQTLPFFTQFFQFQANYDDLPTFTFFVVANAISGGYLILSLPFSIVTIVRSHAKAPRLVLITFDAIALTLTTAAAAASAAIVYLAHKGNANANWLAICQQFDDFCQRTSGSVVGAFIGVVLLMMLVIISTLALRSH